MANDISAFMRSLSSVEQDQLVQLVQGCTQATAPKTIEALERQLEQARAAIKEINTKRDQLRREVEGAEKIAKHLDAEIVRKPASSELRFLRLLVGQRIAKLEEEIEVRRPYKELKLKMELKNAIDDAKQMAHVIALATGYPHG